MRMLWHIAKNALGVVVVLLGIVLSLPLVPGQGLLTILMGLMLLDFPGKRRMEIWMIRRKGIAKGIAWIRRKAGRQPLIIPGDEPAQKPSDSGEGDQ